MRPRKEEMGQSGTDFCPVFPGTTSFLPLSPSPPTASPIMAAGKC